MCNYMLGPFSRFAMWYRTFHRNEIIRPSTVEKPYNRGNACTEEGKENKLVLEVRTSWHKAPKIDRLCPLKGLPLVPSKRWVTQANKNYMPPCI